MKALDEDTRVSSFSLSSSPLGQTAVSGNSTFISDTGNLRFLMYIYVHVHIRVFKVIIIFQIYENALQNTW